MNKYESIDRKKDYTQEQLVDMIVKANALIAEDELKAGDYIKIKSHDGGVNTYIITDDGQLIKCNHIIELQDENGHDIEIDCNVNTSECGERVKGYIIGANMNFPIIYKIQLPFNNITSKYIKKDSRFILQNEIYKILDADYIDEGLINLICEVSLFNSRDDIEKGIVYNSFNRKKYMSDFNESSGRPYIADEIKTSNSINEDQIVAIVKKCLEQDNRK